MWNERSQLSSEGPPAWRTLGRKDSEGRISSLLLGLSRRRALRGMPATTVPLNMKRADLANFLSMRLETVSRVLTRLQRAQIIKVSQHRVEILDRDALRERSSRGAWVADQS